MLSGFNSARVLFVSALFLFAFSFVKLSFADEQAVVARENTLVIGVISTNPKKAFKRSQPFVDFLAANLNQHGITTGRVVVARDVEQMTRWLKSGQVDLVSETVFSAYELIDKAGIDVLARRWKSGKAEYSTVFFSRKEEGVSSFDDLPGKVIVFEDRGSTSSFLIPASILLEQGYELYELTSPRDIPPADKIGYFFSDDFSRSGGETNMMSWVHRNIVASAAFSNLDWEKEVPAKAKEQLDIYYESAPVPRSVVMARPGIPEEVKADIQSVLLSAHETGEGAKALHAYKKTKKFDKVTPDILNSIKWAGERKALLESHLMWQE